MTQQLPHVDVLSHLTVVIKREGIKRGVVEVYPPHEGLLLGGGGIRGGIRVVEEGPHQGGEIRVVEGNHREGGKVINKVKKKNTYIIYIIN